INGKPAAAYFKEAVWIVQVAAMPPANQPKAVMDKITSLNPEFKSPSNHKFEGGEVTELSFMARRVTNISPVRALKHLRSLRLGLRNGKASFSDLRPLYGMKLTTLALNGLQVSDLSHLGGMKLAYLDLERTPV